MYNFNNWLLRFAPKKEKIQSKKKKAQSSTKESDFENVGVAQSSFLSSSKLTAKFIARCLLEADNGTPQQQAALYKMVLDQEPQIVTHLETRKNAVLACKWTVENEKGDDDADTVKALKAAKIGKLNRHLLTAIEFGYAGAVNLWGVGGKLETFKEIDPENIEFDMGGNPALVCLDGERRPFCDYIEGQFILHAHKLRPGIPCQGGLLRALVWLHFYKLYGQQHIAQFLEKFGSPFLLGKMSTADFDNPEVKNETLESLSNIGINGAGVVPEDTEVTAVQTTVSGSTQSYLDWFKYIDDVFVLLILGQKATSDTASGMSNGNAQENVRQDILEADCNALAETINTQLLSYMSFFKTGSKDSEYQFKFDYAPPEDLKYEAEIITTLANGGYKATQEHVEKKFNIPLQKPTEEDKGSKNTPNDGKQELSDKPLILSDDMTFIAKEEAINTLTKNTAKQLFSTSEAMSEFYKPLQAEIREAFKDIDPEDQNIVQAFSDRLDAFFKKYPAIYDAMETGKFQEKLQASLLAAMVNGYIQ